MKRGETDPTPDILPHGALSAEPKWRANALIHTVGDGAAASPQGRSPPALSLPCCATALSTPSALTTTTFSTAQHIVVRSLLPLSPALMASSSTSAAAVSAAAAAPAVAVAVATTERGPASTSTGRPVLFSESRKRSPHTGEWTQRRIPPTPCLAGLRTHSSAAPRSHCSPPSAPRVRVSPVFLLRLLLPSLPPPPSCLSVCLCQAEA